MASTKKPKAALSFTFSKLEEALKEWDSAENPPHELEDPQFHLRKKTKDLLCRLKEQLDDLSRPETSDDWFLRAKSSEH